MEVKKKRFDFKDKHSHLSPLLKPIENVPGINVLMYFIGGEFTLFPFHVEDQDLLSISYISSGSSKVCYFIPASLKTRFESFLTTAPLAFQYLNDQYGGVWQIISTKSILLDPNLMTRISSHFRWRYERSCNTTISLSYLDPRFTIVGLARDITSQRAINFPSSYGRNMVEFPQNSNECDRTFMPLTLPVERIFWMEAHVIIEAMENEKLFSDAASAYKPCVKRLDKALHGSVAAIAKNDERKSSHLTDNGRESEKMMGRSTTVRTSKNVLTANVESILSYKPP